MKKSNRYALYFVTGLMLGLCSYSYGKTPGGKYYHLSGTINGNIPIVMNLTVINDTLYGNYQVIMAKKGMVRPPWQNGGNSIPLYGKVTSRGNYTIRENPWEKGAQFSGRFTADHSLKGEWRSEDGKSVFPFELREAASGGSLPFQVSFLKGSIPLVKKSGSPRASYEYCLLTPEESSDRIISDSLFRSIYLAFYGKPVRKVDPEMLLTSVERSYSENYYSTNAPIYEKDMGMSFNWESLRWMDIVTNSQSLLSFFVEQYSFTGGAHGLQTREYINISLKKGNRLMLKDLFRGDFLRSLTDVITEKVRTMHDLPSGSRLTEHGFFTDEITPTENFYITINGIGFYYNHYEIAPYSNGPDDVFLPYSDLKALSISEGLLPE